MCCHNLLEFNKFQVEHIVKHLKKKNAKTLAEKEYHAAVFIQYNSERLRNIFCSSICSLRKTCLHKKA